jgi:hypothetical protein
LLDVRDILALRLVTPKTRDWVDAVMPKVKSKATLYVDYEDDENEDDEDENNVNESTFLDELMNEGMNGIPFFRNMMIRDSSLFSDPLIPSFLRKYGPQIRTVYHYANGNNKTLLSTRLCPTSDSQLS